MSKYPKIAKMVKGVLKTEAGKSGRTTKKSATLMVWGKMEKMGGPTKFGIGVAAMITACQYIIANEVSKQFKHTLTDHEVEYILPGKIPAELTEILGKFPRWIAIEEGADAIWVYWLKARQEHWQANAALKHEKSFQTLNAARAITDIAEFMHRHGFTTLGELFREK